MAYTSTVDERYIGLFISKRAGEYDASGSFGNGYQIGQYQTAYGSLVLLGYRADFDLYALGTLNSGTINVSASSSTWDSFSTLDGDGIGWSFITPTIYLYNSSGQQVASGFGSLSYSYNYLSAGNFYVGVEGSTYASSQYALSYSYSAPFNYAPTNSTLAIIGTGALGSSLTVSGGWIDSNGLNVANTVTGYSYSWYTSGDNSTNWILVGTGSTYVVKETDLGKYIDVLISYTDDNKFSEIVSPNSALIPGQTDTTPPTISYSTNKSSLGVGETATITFTLSESSTNFTAGDVSVTGGTLSNFSGSGTTYTATFTPTSNSTATGVINVNSGVFTDAAGNANPTSMTLSIAVNTVPADTTPPTIAISTSSSSLSQSQTANITFTLSESSTNFTLSDVTVTGGALSNFSGSGTTYTALFTPTANSTTNGVVRVANGVFTDASGNANADGSDTNNTVTMTVNTVPSDTTPPTIAISTSSSSLSQSQTANITFTLSESSTNFTAGDITVTGGTLSNFSGSGTTYNALFTPTANSTTNGVVRVASGVFTDAAGNANADGSDTNNTVTMTVNTVPSDTTPPTIAISTSSSSLSQSQTANITFTLSESSTNFTLSDVTVTGGALSNFSGSGTTYTALFTPTANSTSNGVVRVANGVFTDASGNGNSDGSDTNNTVTMTVNTITVGKIYEGTTGNDNIAGTNGNDTLDGGAGTDTASWSQTSSNYQLTATPNGWKVTDKTGADGTDTVTNIEKLQFADRTVIIESKDHGSYADLPTELYQFFITAFNAAPGVTYMDQLAEAYRYGLSVKQIVDIFTTKKQFTDVYSPSLSHQDMATQLVNNIVKNSANTSAKTEAIADIKGALDIGWTVGDVIYTVFGNLANKPLIDVNWGNTAKQFGNEITVAKYYTEVLNQSTTDLETLRDAIQPVTQATDVSSDVVIAQIVGVALMTGGLGPGP